MQKKKGFFPYHLSLLLIILLIYIYVKRFFAILFIINILIKIGRQYFTQPPMVGRQYFTQPPVVDRYYFTQPPTVGRYYFTHPPVVGRYYFTQPPVVGRQYVYSNKWEQSSGSSASISLKYCCKAERVVCPVISINLS